jgi:hypothetical protein
MIRRQRCGLSQLVLSAPSDNHPAGSTGLDCRGIDKPCFHLSSDPKHLSQARPPQDPRYFAPEITRERAGSNRNNPCRSPLQFACTCFCELPKPSPGAVLHAKSVQTFPSDHLEGSSDISGLAALFIHHPTHSRLASCNTTPHPSSKFDPSGLDRLSFASHPPIRKLHSSQFRKTGVREILEHGLPSGLFGGEPTAAGRH